LTFDGKYSLRPIFRIEFIYDDSRDQDPADRRENSDYGRDLGNMRDHHEEAPISQDVIDLLKELQSRVNRGEA
jgi:hypothetical protein